MEFRTYLEHVRADSERILALAPGNLEREVPCCPGWKVQEVVRHLAEVYEHKILCTELAARPDPWPPAWPPERDPLEWLGDAQGRLLELLSAKGAKTPSWTWYPPEQTAGFWGRRMAHETVIHRVDVELAVGSISPVEPELGLDGIDE
ncbi:MAG: maleylpyruvate isomerase family mycothiol-dependent enzyme, partial [Candidatus Dormibacteria bacterium]